MISKEEIQVLLHSTENFRVERTVSTTNMDKFCEAICAFSNDLPDSRQKGYLLLCAGWNNTAYYPSNIDLQSSLTIENSCSSEFTLRTMALVSILIPFVLAYIAYAWWSLDKKKIDEKDVNEGHAY